MSIPLVLFYINEEAIGNGTDKVSWNNDMVDNYWSDYIGNGSYVIDQNNVDSHPLTQQVEISSTSTPKSIQPSADLTLPIAVTVVVLAVAIALLLNRRLKTSSLKQ